MMKVNFKKNIAFLSLLFFAVFAFCSCSSDEEITNSDANSELVKEATVLYVKKLSPLGWLN